MEEELSRQEREAGKKDGKEEVEIRKRNRTKKGKRIEKYNTMKERWQGIETCEGGEDGGRGAVWRSGGKDLREVAEEE